MHIIKFFNCLEFNDYLFFNKYIDNIFTYNLFLIKNFNWNLTLSVKPSFF